MRNFASYRCGRQLQKAFLKVKAPLDNESGIALVLAMGMLVIMSIIGALSLSTSSTELGLSGNYKTSQLAFYSAQRAVEYSMTHGDIYSAIGTSSIDLETGDHPANIAGGTNEAMGIYQHPTDADDGPEDNKVTFMAAGGLPPGSGSDPTYFEARYYIVNVSGEGPNRSIARVETQIGRIVPK